MWARARPEILGPTAPLLQKQIQHSLLGTGALTGQGGANEEDERKRKKKKCSPRERLGEGALALFSSLEHDVL